MRVLVSQSLNVVRRPPVGPGRRWLAWFGGIPRWVLAGGGWRGLGVSLSGPWQAMAGLFWGVRAELRPILR